MRRGRAGRRTWVALAAVTLALPGAGVAAATVRPLASPFGGGVLGPRFVSGNHSDLAKLRVRPSRDGRSALLFASLNSRCEGIGSITAEPPAQTVRIRRDGSFAARGSIGEDVGGGERQDGAFSLSGRFTSRARVVVTGHARFVLTTADGVRHRCDSGYKRMTAVVPSAPGLSGARARGASYFGVTSQDSGLVPGTRLPLSLRVSGDGRRVAQAQIEWNGSCQSGQGTGGSTVSPPMRIRRDGSFSFVERYRNEYTDTVEEYTSQPRGRFGPRSVTGTWRIAYVERRRSDGAIIDRCDTGPIRWRAAR